MYVSFFGVVTADDVVDFGEAKATQYGRTTVAKEAQILGTLTSDGAKATVTALLAELRENSEALAAAGTAREDAKTALDALDIERRQLLRDTIALIADTEVGILTVHKGRRDLVDAVLALDHEATRAKKKPTTPPA